MRTSHLRSSLLVLLLAAPLAAGCDDDGGGAVDAAGGATGDASVAGMGGGGSGGGTSDGGVDASGDGANVTMATATLMPTSLTLAGDAGVSMAAGSVTFTQSGGTVTIQVSVNKTTPGDHGLHIHMNGSCADTPMMGDAALVPAGGAGGHWNPKNMNHGHLGGDGGAHHAGDLGNITVAAGGTGTKTVTTTEWRVADVVGRSVILHAGADDLVTNPTGNAGGRVACGVVVAQ